MEDVITMSNTYNRLASAMVKKDENGFFFGVYDINVHLNWQKVSKNFYDSFVNEFKDEL